MRKITSRSNETIKFIKSLQLRKNRNKTGKFYFEGVRQVGESFLSNYPLDLTGLRVRSRSGKYHHGSAQHLSARPGALRAGPD